jgi:hypothetical protein
MVFHRISRKTSRKFLRRKILTNTPQRFSLKATCLQAQARNRQHFPTGGKCKKTTDGDDL